jgi:hypothetical protein
LYVDLVRFGSVLFYTQERCGIIDWRTLQCSGLVTYEGTSVIGSHSQDFAGRKAILFSYEITCNYGCLVPIHSKKSKHFKDEERERETSWNDNLKRNE